MSAQLLHRSFQFRDSKLDEVIVSSCEHLMIQLQSTRNNAAAEVDRYMTGPPSNKGASTSIEQTTEIPFLRASSVTTRSSRVKAAAKLGADLVMLAGDSRLS